MKKLFISLMSVAAAAVLFVISKNNQMLYSLGDNNVESLTYKLDSPNPNDDYWTNFKSTTVWYPASGTATASIGVNLSYWERLAISVTCGCSVTWNSHSCCVNGADIDACDFNDEETNWCPSHVTRASRY